MPRLGPSTQSAPCAPSTCTPRLPTCRAWFDQHPELFGGRSYRASAFTVDRLIRIERVRAQLDGQAGEPQ